MSTARLADVPATAIRLTAANPRSDGEADLAGLATALGHGLAQRPTLLEVEPGVFEVFMGERRVRAMLAAGWLTIPAVIDDPPDPIDAHTRRVMENLHRKDLGPIDEARALKIAWLCANADALVLRAEANSALASAPDRDGALTALLGVLTEAGWHVSRPTVTQEAYLAGIGLALSKAALRKKLQVLNLNEAVQQQAQQAGMTAAAIRAVMRLEADDQQALMDAIGDAPDLSRSVRTIVEGVKKKGRSVEDAIAIACGHVPGMDMNPAPASPPVPDNADAPQPQIDAAAAMDAVLALLDAAQSVAGRLTELRTLCGSVGVAAVPEPWGDYLREALTILQDTLKETI